MRMRIGVGEQNKHIYFGHSIPKDGISVSMNVTIRLTCWIRYQREEMNPIQSCYNLAHNITIISKLQCQRVQSTKSASFNVFYFFFFLLIIFYLFITPFNA